MVCIQMILDQLSKLYIIFELAHEFDFNYSQAWDN